MIARVVDYDDGWKKNGDVHLIFDDGDSQLWNDVDNASKAGRVSILLEQVAHGQAHNELLSSLPLFESQMRKRMKRK